MGVPAIFRAARSILFKVPFNLFSRPLVSVLVVVPYYRTKPVVARKKVSLNVRFPDTLKFVYRISGFSYSYVNIFLS